MTDSEEPGVSDVRSYAWLVFAGFGLIFVAYGIYGFTLQFLEPGHWEWLTNSNNVADYLGGIFRILGMLSFGFGALTIAIAYASFRRGDKWAWYAFMLFPVFFLVAIPVTWLGIMCLPFVLVSLAALWIARPSSS